MPKSVSYHDHLMQFLSNPIAAAAYLQEILEDRNIEPELLPSSLKDIAEALGEVKMSSEAAKLHREKLHDLFNQRGIDAIYGLANWLNDLGLQLTVTVKEDQEKPIENLVKNKEVVIANC